MDKQLYADLEMEDYKLEYYLIEDDNCGYGIQIDKLSNQKVAESSSVYDVCTKKGDVCNLIQKIKNGTVTPVSLEEIVYDWICE